MNFYMGNSVNEIDIQDSNVEFSDELIHFIYKKSRQVSFDMSKLYKIDPYGDVEVAENDLPYIIGICNYILSTSLLDEYGESEEGKRMLHGLAEMAHEAMARSLGLVSVGD